jgi:hypothetical protein
MGRPVEPCDLEFARGKRALRAGWAAIAAMTGLNELDLRAAMEVDAPDETLLDQVRERLNDAARGRADALLEVVEALLGGLETVPDIAESLRLGQLTIRNRLQALERLKIVRRRAQVRDNAQLWSVIDQEGR